MVEDRREARSTKGEPAMNRTPSFAQRMRAGESKEQLMKYFCISEAQYQKVITCLERIRQEASV